MNARVMTGVWQVSSVLSGLKATVYTVFLVLSVPAILYLALYAPIPAVHDAMHHLRHSVWGVPCH